MDTGQTDEIRAVERWNLADAVRIHSCGKSCVMDLYARDIVLDDDPSPLAVDGFRVSEESEAALDGRFSLSLLP